ncbi:MAG: aminopeptidase P family protein [Betaproteobacteria bacterium]|nr:aminopeptidase P family protein [Betaproteobacteria bacterium]
MVKEASRLTFGPSTTDVVEGINVPRMRAERAAGARKEMIKRKIPVALVTGSENVRYLVGFYWGEFVNQLSYVLFFAEGDPILFAHAGCYQQMPDQNPWIKEWRIGRSWLGGIGGPSATAQETKKFAQEIKSELAERGLATEQLAVVDFDVTAWNALQREGLKLMDGSEWLLEAAKIKTVDEINCLKMTASIACVGYDSAVRNLRAGMTQGQISRIVTNAIGEAGAEFARGRFLSGPLSFERGVSFVDRRIEHGDLLYMPTCGTSYMGYAACLYRQFVVGRKPTGREVGWYNEMRDRIDKVIDAIRPGATTADAAKHFPPASKWGYKDEAEVLTVEIGHGVGLVNPGGRHAHYNPPVINRQWSMEHPQVFEPGMVIAVESLEGEHRVGGVRLEDMMVVTETGAEIIDFYPRDNILVAGD